MPGSQSSVEIIICKNCGTQNKRLKSSASRYFEGNKPSLPMHMNNYQRRGQQQFIPLCQGCRKPLF